MYDLFVIDPPWPKKKGGLRKVTPNQTRELDYKTLPVSAIFEILDSHIFPVASENHTVFMWTIDQFLYEAEFEMKKRGYRLHARIVWDKGMGLLQLLQSALLMNIFSGFTSQR